MPAIYSKYREIGTPYWLDLDQTPDSILRRHNPITPGVEYQYKWYDHTHAEDEASVLTFRQTPDNKNLSPDQFAAQQGFPGLPALPAVQAPVEPVAIPEPPAGREWPAEAVASLHPPVASEGLEEQHHGTWIYVLFVILIVCGYLTMLYFHKS